MGGPTYNTDKKPDAVTDAAVVDEKPVEEVKPEAEVTAVVNEDPPESVGE